MYLLVINPGGTSTKVAVYEDKKEVLKKNITCLLYTSDAADD